MIHTSKFINKNFRIKVSGIDNEGNWKIQCKLPPKTKRFCPLVLK